MKHFAKADNYNLRKLAKRSNIPEAAGGTTSLVRRHTTKATPHGSNQKKPKKGRDELMIGPHGAGGILMTSNENCTGVYDIEALDYEDVSIYTRAPNDSKSVYINDEINAAEAHAMLSKGLSPRRLVDDRVPTGSVNRKKAIGSVNDVNKTFGNIMSK